MTTETFKICSETGKRGFRDERAAGRALGRAQHRRERGMDRRGTRRGARLETRKYYCEACEMYHLTGQSGQSFRQFEGAMA